METRPNNAVIQKRAKALEEHKGKDAYLVYQQGKSPEMPDTPRPDVGSKRNWEHRMYSWRAAIRAVFHETLSDN